MAYELKWGSKHPGHLVYLLDLSESMSRNGKIDYLLEAVKTTSEFLIEKSTQGSVLKDRFSISIIGYNTDVYTLFKGSVTELDAFLDKVYDQGGEDAPIFDKTTEAIPRWQTYTAKAFRAVVDDIREWMNNQQRKDMPMPAPMIIHVTDGFPYESERPQTEAREDALRAAEEIKQISLPDGNPLLFNIHIEDGNASEILFPTQAPDDAGQQFLFNSSSVMPDSFAKIGRDLFKFPSQQGCRYMASNVKDKVKLVQLITFGSTVVGAGDVEQPKPGQRPFRPDIIID
jgi:uncharacterized protein YegL